MAETFRKALVEVLVPEIRELREEMHSGFTELRQETSQLREEMHTGFTELRQETSQLRQEVVQLRQGQELILERLDILPRMARLELLFEQHLKAS